MKKAILFFFLVFSSGVFSQTPLFIPDTLAGPNYTLMMHRDSVQFFPQGKPSYTYSYNQYSYLGPTLIFNKGTDVSIQVHNQIGDTTTLHWHGIHLPPKWDGGPHNLVMPGATWNPQFKVMNSAATYWYHPHTHMKTAAQAIKGAVGLIIVKDPIENALMLPRSYGIDDFPVIAQCQQYDPNNQAMPLGMEDSTLIVNGARANNGYSVYANFPAQVVRMRLLNGSGERVFNFGFTGNMKFYQIASDGGLLDQPYLTDRIRLSPGERAEILIDLSSMIGQSFYLMSYASELSMGIQGGPTMPMPNGPPMDSPLNGIDFNIMKINVVAALPNAIKTIPVSLTTNTVYPTSSANVKRTIRFTADSIMVMDGPFYFNDSSFDMERIDYRIPLNNIEIWKLVNQTMVAHPFHIHDVQFYMIERGGALPGLGERGKKDVVLVPPGDSVMFITKFEDFADTTIPFMYHCHILMHEDDGMMGQFVVTPVTVGIKDLSNVNETMLVYPNPANKFIKIDVDGFEEKDISSITIYNVLGSEIYTESKPLKKSFQINVSDWKKGVYIIHMTYKNRDLNKKLVID